MKSAWIHTNARQVVLQCVRVSDHHTWMSGWVFMHYIPLRACICTCVHMPVCLHVYVCACGFVCVVNMAECSISNSFETFYNKNQFSGAKVCVFNKLI